MSRESINGQQSTNSNKQLSTMRHSCSHLMALAVKELYPRVKFGIGPAIENGFYYDFDFSKVNSKLQIPKLEDLPKIEKKMRQLAKKNLKFEKKEMAIKEAKKIFKDQPYKLELIEDIKKESGIRNQESRNKLCVTCYVLRDFTDLCKGPLLNSTSQINAFKLTRLAGAYWKGDEKNPMLTRIYGLAFPSQEELDNYLKLQEQAEARDHRKLGQELDLFSLQEEFGAGLPLWHPKGALLRYLIEQFILKEYLKRGYQLVQTPHIAKLNLFKTSGHWDFYRENIYSPIKIDDEEYIVKPMNCPGHILIYKSQMRSYRDLPIRYTELGTVYRYERSGVLHGLTRVRGFTQDDAHIICTQEQLEKELIEAIKLTKFILKTFGFKNFKVALSVRDPKNKKKYLGDDKIWALAENALAKAIEKQRWTYQREEGEAVFYGPKMDVKVADSLSREWQVSTLQVDFNLPEKFNITYIDKGGKKKRPIMLHRALLGSLERFIGLLIEHYAGAFPVWLSPVQVYIIPVGRAHIKPSQKLAKELETNGIRCQIDDLNETVSYKIRKSEKLKIPYILVIGDKEAKGKTLNVRLRGQKKIFKITKKQFIERVKENIEKKK
jgi:threonyl-tRNA synthetase